MCSSFFQNGEQINLSHKWNSRSLPHADIHTAIHIFLALLSWKKYLPLNQHVIFHICNSAEWFYWIVSMSKNMQLSYNLVLLVQLYNFVHISKYLISLSENFSYVLLPRKFWFWMSLTFLLEQSYDAMNLPRNKTFPKCQ